LTSLDNKAAQKALERQLVVALERGGSPVACEYICSKLTMIGSESAVPALAARLNARDTATAARTALEAIAGHKAAMALRASLPKIKGVQKIGVINFLGARRDGESVRALAGLMEHADAAVASAAIAALGDIASSKAARALRDFQTRAPENLRLRMA